jgi:hypothetical protein
MFSLSETLHAEYWNTSVLCKEYSLLYHLHYLSKFNLPTNIISTLLSPKSINWNQLKEMCVFSLHLYPAELSRNQSIVVPIVEKLSVSVHECGLIVCKPCGEAFVAESLRDHFARTHRPATISEADLVELIADYGAAQRIDDPRITQVRASGYVAEAIPGLPILENGVQCMAPKCLRIFSSLQSYQAHARKVAHHELEISAPSKACQAYQRIFTDNQKSFSVRVLSDPAPAVSNLDLLKARMARQKERLSKYFLGI